VQALCTVALLVGLPVTLEQILRPLLVQLGGGPQVSHHPTAWRSLKTCLVVKPSYTDGSVEF